MKKKHTAQFGSFSLQLVLCSSGSLLDDHGNTVGFLPSRSANESFSSGSCRTDVCRTRRLSASDRGGLLASSHLAERAARSQAIARRGDVSGADSKRKSQIICATRRRWRITGNGRLLPSSCRLKWIAWRSTPNSPRCCANSFKRLGNDPVVIAECLARPVLSRASDYVCI